mgnify:CR=1 FL=1
MDMVPEQRLYILGGILCDGMRLVKGRNGFVAYLYIMLKFLEFLPRKKPLSITVNYHEIDDSQNYCFMS